MQQLRSGFALYKCDIAVLKPRSRLAGEAPMHPQCSSFVCLPELACSVGRVNLLVNNSY